MTQMENLKNFTKNILKGNEDLQFNKINILMKDSFEFQVRSILELFDKEISNQVSIDKRHIKQYREDSINLGYIKVKFKKTQFEWNPKNELKIGKKYFCPIDKYLNVTNSEKHNLKLLLGIVEEIIKTRSYKNLTSKMDGIYPKWISKMLKKLKFEYEIKQLRTKTETLFLCLDGQWFNTHKNTGRRKEMKFGICWTGVKQIYNRPVLQERTIISMQNTKNTNEIAYKILDIVERVYGDIKEIKIVGDGASWITNVANIINDFIPTTRYIDKYHYKDYLYRFWGKNKSKCFSDTSFLHSWDWKGIKEYILKIKFATITKDGEIIYKNKNEYPDLFKSLSKVERSNFYKLKKFNEKYKKNINSGNTINPIEGIQSNYFAKFFRGRRAFNLDNLIKLLELQTCYLNNWKVSLARDNYSWMKLNISEYKTWDEFDLASDGKFRPDPPKEVGLKISGLKRNVILKLIIKT